MLQNCRNFLADPFYLVVLSFSIWCQKLDRNCCSIMRTRGIFCLNYLLSYQLRNHSIAMNSKISSFCCFRDFYWFSFKFWAQRDREGWRSFCSVKSRSALKLCYEASLPSSSSWSCRSFITVHQHLKCDIYSIYIFLVIELYKHLFS